MRVVLLNDTRVSQHLGCSLVVERILELLGEFRCEVTAIKMKGTPESILSMLPMHIDLVLINGEGTMHGDSVGGLKILEVVKRLKNKCSKVFLINSVWQNNNRLNELLPLLNGIYVRDRISLREVQRQGFEGYFVPDLTLSIDKSSLAIDDGLNRSSTSSLVVLDSQVWDHWLKLARYSSKQECRFFRMDSHRSLRTWSGWKRMLQKMRSVPSPLLDRDNVHILMSSDLIITGRFHGLCLAMLSNTPAIGIDAKTSKISSLSVDSGLSRFYPVVDGNTHQTVLDDNILLHREKLERYMRDPIERRYFQQGLDCFLKKARSESKRMMSQIMLPDGQ